MAITDYVGAADTAGRFALAWRDENRSVAVGCVAWLRTADNQVCALAAGFELAVARSGTGCDAGCGVFAVGADELPDSICCRMRWSKVKYWPLQDKPKTWMREADVWRAEL